MRLIVLTVLVACSKGPPQPSIGAVAQPYGAVAKVTLGMSRDDVAKVAPDLKEGTPTLWVAHQDPMIYRVYFTDRDPIVVKEIEIVDTKHTEADVHAAWGAGAASTQSAQETMYSNAAHTMSAVLYVSGADVKEPFVSLEFHPMQSLATQLGDHPSLGLFDIDVMDENVDMVEMRMKRFDPMYAGGWTYVDKLPRNEYGTFLFGYWREVLLEGTPNQFRSNVSMVSYHFTLNVANARPAVLALLEKKWGKPRIEDDRYFWTVGKRELSGTVHDDEITLISVH
jgi:hypothetical protein